MPGRWSPRSIRRTSPRRWWRRAFRSATPRSSPSSASPAASASPSSNIKARAPTSRASPPCPRARGRTPETFDAPTLLLPKIRAVVAAAARPTAAGSVRDELSNVLEGAASKRGQRIAAFQRGDDAPVRVLEFVPSYVWFFLKLSGLLFVYIWLRATLPRMRVDQMMNVAWKFMLPMAFTCVPGASQSRRSTGSCELVQVQTTSAPRRISSAVPPSRRLHRRISTSPRTTRWPAASPRSSPRRTAASTCS